MPQPDHPARHRRSTGPTRRGDSTRPTPTRTSARRGGDRRPYPTASTTTRVSPAKPRPATRAQSRDSTETAQNTARHTAQKAVTPATVWTADPAPIDLDASWPTPIVSTIVAAFSQPGARVVLLPWPTPQPTSQPPSPAAAGKRRGLSVVGADGVIDDAPGANPNSAPDTDASTELTAALAAVERLDRTGHVVRVATEENLTGPASRPFWADLVGDPDPGPDRALVPASPPSPSSRSGLDSTVLDGPDAVSPHTDLIITSLRVHRDDVTRDHASDLVALVAARLLRVGGILAVITHCDWPQGELIDPTGAVVASAQNADLLYLQHIVALHVPMRDGRFATELLTDIPGPADDSDRGSGESSVEGGVHRATAAARSRGVVEQQARATHRAAVRGLPAPHQRVHSDVLVFAQPHEYEPLSVRPAEQEFQSGVIR